MSKTNYFPVSPKEYKVLLALFEYRGLTIEQLLKVLGYKSKGLTNMYKPIRSLSTLGYISAHVLFQKRTKKIYYLSQKGYSVMVEQLSIPLGYRGKGYNKDYGDFSYDLYKPPTNLTIHHQLLVDFLIAADEFKKEIEKKNKLEHTFVFRDNRYAARDYIRTIENPGKVPEKRKGLFRPDAEVIINSNTCFVEVDTGSERGRNLTQKFEGYKSYFEYLKEKKLPLPSAIIFISEDMQTNVQKNRRWQSISKHFLVSLEEYATEVNLIFDTIDNAKNLLLKEYKSEENQRETLNFIARDSAVFRMKDLPGILKMVPLSLSPKQDKLFVFSNIEGYETKGWAILEEFKGEFKKEYDKQSIKFKEIIPVLIFKDNPPASLDFYKEKVKDNIIYKEHIHLKVKGQFGTWLNKELEVVRDNPLTGSK